MVKRCESEKPHFTLLSLCGNRIGLPYSSLLPLCDSTWPGLPGSRFSLGHGGLCETEPPNRFGSALSVGLVGPFITSHTVAGENMQEWIKLHSFSLSFPSLAQADQTDVGLGLSLAASNQQHPLTNLADLTARHPLEIRPPTPDLNFQQ